MIGNAFRVAYSVQIKSDLENQQESLSDLNQDQRSPSVRNQCYIQDTSQEGYVPISQEEKSGLKNMISHHNNPNNNNHALNNNKKGPFTQSRSVESLLSSGINQARDVPFPLPNGTYSEEENPDDGCYANLDEIRYFDTAHLETSSRQMRENKKNNQFDMAADEPFYETADFVRVSRERMSDNTFSRKSATNLFHSVSIITTKHLLQKANSFNGNVILFTNN